MSACSGETEQPQPVINVLSVAHLGLAQLDATYGADAPIPVTI